MTALGIAVGVICHVTYCAFGLAYLIVHSRWLFNLLKLLGGSYLLYIGVQSIYMRVIKEANDSEALLTSMTLWQAFKQGFFTNALNAKAILFFLATFTYVVKTHITFVLYVLLAFELFFVVLTWFCLLTYLLSINKINDFLQRYQLIVVRIMGAILILIGLIIIFSII